MARSQAQYQSAPDASLPMQELTIEETLRVMDVAREMRDKRKDAEQMFQRDGVRSQLREKLMRQAEMLHENVTEAEIDAAIDQYLSTLHTYEDPEPGFKSFLAHCWIRRAQIALGLTATAVATALTIGSYWFFFASTLVLMDARKAEFLGSPGSNATVMTVLPERSNHSTRKFVR